MMLIGSDSDGRISYRQRMMLIESDSDARISYRTASE